MLGRDASAEVANVEFNAALGGNGTEFDPSSGSAILHGVVDQIGENLMDRLAIGQDQRQRFHRAAVEDAAGSSMAGRCLRST